MKTPVLHSGFFALIGLGLAAIPAAHASTRPSDSEDVAFCRVIDSQEAPSAAKATALKVEYPRTVRMIYFRPNDRPFRAEVVNSMKVAMRQIQAFFAEEMQRHGHGNLTFRFETDDQGEPLVHRVDGEHADAHYLQQSGARGEIWRALGRRPIEVVVLDLSANTVPYFSGGAGAVTWRGKQGDLKVATVLVPSGFSWRIVAHELGHAFDLEHDFRDSEYIMSYGGGNRARLSACAAEYLTVHPYFNPRIKVAQGASRSTIDLISPPGYPAGSTRIPIRLDIGNSSGLHQVLLFATTQLPHFAAGGAEVKECRSFSGERTAVVEFDYDGVIPSKANSSLADPIVHRMRFWAVDTSGRVSLRSFTLHQLSDRHIATLEEPGFLTALAFSPDGTTLASASRAEKAPVKLWDVETREIIARFGSASPGLAVAISPDGATLASEHNGTVKLWEVATATRTATLEGRPGDTRFRAVAFSPPDGATLAVVSGERTVELWDLATEAKYADLDHDSKVNSLAFSPDGTSLATATTEGMVILWDPATGERTAVVGGHAGWVGAVTFSPDGATLASQAGWDGLVKLWDVKTQRTVATIENVRGGSAMAFSRWGYLACASGELVKLWDVDTRVQIDSLAHQATVRVVAFSPDGETLATGTWKGVELWDVSEWTESRPQSLVKTSGEGQEGPAGRPLAKPFVVSVLDQNGSAFAGAVVRFSVTTGGGTLSPTTATTDANGRARSTLTLGPNLGNNTVMATVEGLGPVTFTATATEQAPHSLTKVSGNSQEGPTSTQLDEPLVVSVLDQGGSPLAGVDVTFSVAAGGGTLSATAVTTDANGQARTTLTLGSDPGTNTVEATVAGLEPETFIATAIERMPHSLDKVSGEGQEGPANTQLAEPFVVSVLDQGGSPLAEASVTFAVTAGEGMLSSTIDTNPCTIEASTSSTTATTDANGQATTRLTLGSQPGTHAVEATVEGLEPVTFTAAATEPARPHRLTKICGDDQEGTAIVLLDEPLVVVVSDEDNAAMAGVVVSFAVTAGGGTLSDATATTDANGRAATRLTLGIEAGTNAVAATVAGLESVTFTATAQESPFVSLFDALFGGGKRVALPDSPQLAQNAPNPFNSQTVFSYFLPAPGLARVEVFALTGQRVAVLHQGPQQAGYHRLHWDGRDDAGRSVASGLYLYRLVTDEAVLTRKLLLLR